MLKITRESDPIQIEQLTLCLYAPPGVGKTSISFTAEAPLLFDFDSGAYRSQYRKDSVQVSSWKDVANVTADDLVDYKSIIVDTAGRALDALAVEIIAENPKLGYGGALTLQGYGQLKSRFIAWNKMIRSFGKDVILLAHSDEQHKGDDIIERLDVQGGSKNEIYKSADVMGRLAMISGKRILNFNPTDTAFGKNPANLPALEVPSFDTNPQYLAGVISQIKEALNRLTEEQKKVMEMMANWKAKIEENNTLDHFNKLIEETQKADGKVRDNVKRLLVSTAIDCGFMFDKKEKQFKEKVAA